MFPMNHSIHSHSIDGLLVVTCGVRWDGQDPEHVGIETTPDGIEITYYLHADGEALAFAEDFRRLAAEIEIVIRQRKAARQVAPAICGAHEVPHV